MAARSSIVLVLLLAACSSAVGIPIGEALPDGDADTDVDADGDVDADADTDAGADADANEEVVIDVDAGLNAPWVEIPAGTFMMGSPLTEGGRCGGGDSGHAPGEDLHQVTLTRGFVIQATEVTQAQFEAVLGYDPSDYGECPDCPVDSVGWYEAAAYCNALSAGAGLDPCYDCLLSGRVVECQPTEAFATPYDCPGYRLPTEAEWEYAARAGTTTATYNGDLEDADCPSAVLEPISWYCDRSDEHVHPVAALRPNAWVGPSAKNADLVKGRSDSRSHEPAGRIDIVERAHRCSAERPSTDIGAPRSRWFDLWAHVAGPPSSTSP